MLRVMSFNLRTGTADDGPNSWPQRCDTVIRVVERLAPDVLGVQECLDFQGEFLRTRLPGYGFVGVGRNDGVRAGEFAAVLYKRDRLKMLDVRHTWLSLTPEVPGSKGWDAHMSRNATLATLEDRLTAMRFIAINTHLDHRGVLSRTESARVLAAQLHPATPTVLMGDLNCLPDSEPYRLLVGDGREGGPLRDTHRVAGHDETDAGTFHSFTLQAQGRRIDYIFVSPHWSVAATAIDRSTPDDRPPSDHFPITATIALGQ
ncbi:MAG: endonuclease/exonuclease/phosphatase family protein [Phycisphaeraceae bacterium]